MGVDSKFCVQFDEQWMDISEAVSYAMIPICFASICSITYIDHFQPSKNGSLPKRRAKIPLYLFDDYVNRKRNMLLLASMAQPMMCLLMEEQRILNLTRFNIADKYGELAFYEELSQILDIARFALMAYTIFIGANSRKPISATLGAIFSSVVFALHLFCEMRRCAKAYCIGDGSFEFELASVMPPMAAMCAVCIMIIRTAISKLRGRQTRAEMKISIAIERRDELYEYLSYKLRSIEKQKRQNERDKKDEQSEYYCIHFWRVFIYRNLPHFKYPLAILLSVSTSCMLLYLMFVRLLSNAYSHNGYVYAVNNFLVSVLNLIHDVKPEEIADVHSTFIAPPLFEWTTKVMGRSYTNDTFEIVVPDIGRTLEYTSSWCYTINVTIVIFVFFRSIGGQLLALRTFRANLILAWKGDYKRMHRIIKHDQPWELGGQSFEYIGSHIGYSVVGYIIQTFIIYIAMIMFAFLCMLLKEVFRRPWWWKFVLIMIIIILAILIFLFVLPIYWRMFIRKQFVVTTVPDKGKHLKKNAKSILIHFHERLLGGHLDIDRHNQLAIKNHITLSNVGVLLVVFSLGTSIVQTPMRWVRAWVRAMFRVGRMDLALLNVHYEDSDPAWCMYSSYILTEVAHSHPIMVAFCLMMYDSIGMKFERAGYVLPCGNIVKQKKIIKLSKYISLLLTLENNKQLCTLRKHQIENFSSTQSTPHRTASRSTSTNFTSIE